MDKITCYYGGMNMAGKLKNDYTGWVMKEHGVPDSRLTVLYRAPNDKRNKVMWHCRCECGNEFDVRSDSLSGNTKSCGCLNKEAIASIGHLCAKDITGQRYGKLIAIRPTDKKGTRPGIYWLCQCDCGNTTEAIVADLTCGKVTSCGCSRLPKDSLVGKIFGRLTVLEYAGTADGGNGALYKCLCTCGKYVTTRANSLRQGATQSCGCLQKERAHENYRDISGERFGFLTALYPIGAQQGKTSMVWHCRCDCGNEKDVALTYLRSGNSRSCGCQKSLGEAEINRILSQTNLKYIHDKNYFDDLYSQYHVKLRYDFIIFDENNKPIRLIEFDGIQHFKPIEHFGGEGGFLERQKLDKIKNEYALSHNIPLVRIPYKERGHITLEMIMGDKYLIKPSNG